MFFTFLYTRKLAANVEMITPTIRNKGVVLKNLSAILPANAKITIGTAIINPRSNAKDTNSPRLILVFFVSGSGGIPQGLYEKKHCAAN